MTDRYVHALRDRYKRPRNTKRWYRCVCGRWWGINKRFLCTCGEPPPSMGMTRAEHEAQVAHRLDKLR